jgi:hypothetical protein
MNIAKHMELIFVAAIAVVSATGMASASSPARKVGPVEVVKVGAAPEMMVITVTGRRLSAAEKAQLGN